MVERNFGGTLSEQEQSVSNAVSEDRAAFLDWIGGIRVLGLVPFTPEVGDA
jgi:hypothetical protein